MKKFYKTAHITQVPGRLGYYEINLDTRKLKTPTGTIFQVPGESLALTVAAEWNSQKENIQRHSMHIVCHSMPTSHTRCSLRVSCDVYLDVIEVILFVQRNMPQDILSSLLIIFREQVIKTEYTLPILPKNFGITTLMSPFFVTLVTVACYQVTIFDFLLDFWLTVLWRKL